MPAKYSACPLLPCCRRRERRRPRLGYPELSGRGAEQAVWGPLERCHKTTLSTNSTCLAPPPQFHLLLRPPQRPLPQRDTTTSATRALCAASCSEHRPCWADTCWRTLALNPSAAASVGQCSHRRVPSTATLRFNMVRNGKHNRSKLKNREHVEQGYTRPWTCFTALLTLSIQIGASQSEL